MTLFMMFFFLFFYIVYNVGCLLLYVICVLMCKFFFGNEHELFVFKFLYRYRLYIECGIIYMSHLLCTSMCLCTQNLLIFSNISVYMLYIYNGKHYQG